MDNFKWIIEGNLRQGEWRIGEKYNISSRQVKKLSSIMSIFKLNINTLKLQLLIEIIRQCQNKI